MTIAPALPITQSPVTPSPEPVTEAAGVVVGVLERLGVEFAIGVADSQLSDVLAAIAKQVPLLFAAREDAAVAFAVGRELAGRRSAVFMRTLASARRLTRLSHWPSPRRC